MYICICKAVTDSRIEKAVDEGVRTIKELRLSTQAGSCCGKCLPEAKRCLDSAVLRKRSGIDTVIELQDVA